MDITAHRQTVGEAGNLFECDYFLGQQNRYCNESSLHSAHYHRSDFGESLPFSEVDHAAQQRSSGTGDFYGTVLLSLPLELYNVHLPEKVVCILLFGTEHFKMT